MATKKKLRNSRTKSAGKAEAARSESTFSLSPAAIRTFIAEVKAEFNKVVWPQKKITAGLTGFVLVLVVLISSYLGFVDLVLGKIVTSFLG
ncbi:MAG: preprotein translocase subunit SecE [Desulfobulbus propionicus]|nr:MAG: preprotein translocase subunit SecE [Desulfobulbus propionicus]